MQATYAALNGKEIREILKREFNDRVDKIPGLKIGLTFHRAQLHWAFSMEAFPADVPTPEKEFEFQINSELTSTGANDIHLSKVERIKLQVEKLNEQSEKLNDLISEAEQELSLVLIESQDEVHQLTGDDPNPIRIANKMPVPVIVKTTDGKRVEAMVQPSSFDKSI